MLTILSVVFAATVQAVPLVATMDRLPKINSTRIILNDDSVTIKWQPVKSKLEPVLGYKVKIWVPKPFKILSEKNINGTSVLVEEDKLPNLIDFNEDDGILTEYQLTGPDHTQLIINGIKRGIPHLYKILAYGASGNGDPSATVGFELNSADTTEER